MCILTQEQINKFLLNTESRDKSRQYIFGRSKHNSEIKDSMDELAEETSRPRFNPYYMNS